MLELNDIGFFVQGAGAPALSSKQDGNGDNFDF